MNYFHEETTHSYEIIYFCRFNKSCYHTRIIFILELDIKISIGNENYIFECIF